ncbi:hypothetical protein ATE92_1752 [Ulvibacter sp. MAR_2010_11]|uniref:hypothetical protein n=1 Tax=Ulvibacter sp. MAR_2010_11 TaxID=1250229 RepID=UPI000C2C9E83|nr:hypothetical protein [Ulvibacter sp. MAR_2010_11]PKA83595.1 hypothetical protein ATE92_1752 [Ulvibacter sp. MAR_2010_11]
MQKQKTEFTPILMHKYEDRIVSTIKNAESLAKQWNSALKAAETLLNKQLTDDEKIEILDNGFDEIMTHLRTGFQFKNASDEFNIEAQGINLIPAKNVFAQCTGVYDYNTYEIKQGIVQVSEQGRQLIEKDSCLFTKTERQNEVYRLAERLAACVNEALNTNIISKLDKPGLERAIQIITQPRGLNDFVPDYEVINRITG